MSSSDEKNTGSLYNNCSNTRAIDHISTICEKKPKLIAMHARVCICILTSQTLTPNTRNNEKIKSICKNCLNHSFN